MKPSFDLEEDQPFPCREKLEKKAPFAIYKRVLMSCRGTQLVLNREEILQRSCLSSRMSGRGQTSVWLACRQQQISQELNFPLKVNPNPPHPDSRWFLSPLRPSGRNVETTAVRLLSPHFARLNKPGFPGFLPCRTPIGSRPTFSSPALLNC